MEKKKKNEKLNYTAVMHFSNGKNVGVRVMITDNELVVIKYVQFVGGQAGALGALLIGIFQMLLKNNKELFRINLSQIIHVSRVKRGLSKHAFLITLENDGQCIFVFKYPEKFYHKLKKRLPDLTFENFDNWLYS